MMSTFALCGSRTARCPVRAVASFEADCVKTDVVADGSNTSAVESSAGELVVAEDGSVPPITITIPFSVVVAV
jgi:hypothetical protein